MLEKLIASPLNRGSQDKDRHSALARRLYFEQCSMSSPRKSDRTYKANFHLFLITLTARSPPTFQTSSSSLVACIARRSKDAHILVSDAEGVVA